MKRLTIIGSTGSIGQNTLRVVEHLSHRFQIFALAANSAARQLAEQAAEFHPAVVALGDAGRVDEFQQRCRELKVSIPEIVTGESGLRKITSAADFDIPAEKIDIMVHPQSVMHSMVEFVDGSVVGQLGTADMRQPIQYALTYPERLSSPVPPLDWNLVSRLDFMQPDRKKFPCISLA